ncbi:MAG: hypothetical protein HC886_19120 [Leptolyngbyaceae cyanobacterium SM1_1_3]|nr:hypothetical protein [Leptolyngbyaceae cyanobacterium SM1_1_3]
MSNFQHGLLKLRLLRLLLLQMVFSLFQLFKTRYQPCLTVLNLRLQRLPLLQKRQDLKLSLVKLAKSSLSLSQLG